MLLLFFRSFVARNESRNIGPSYLGRSDNESHKADVHVLGELHGHTFRDRVDCLYDVNGLETWASVHLLIPTDWCGWPGTTLGIGRKWRDRGN